MIYYNKIKYIYYIMNLDNKFGICCKCPAIMDESRLFTNYVPHKSYNRQFMNELNVVNNNDYRHTLQYNLQLNSNDINKQCLRSKNFNIDGSKINTFFDIQFKKLMCTSD